MEAIDKGLIYHGEYVQKDVKDIHPRPFLPHKDGPDYFGTGREDYPYYVDDLKKKDRKSFISQKQEKKLPADYYDDLPEIDDEEFKF
eukprot:CAMPEP_0170529552 /NCGR_PEP_ID=MMETSP0209-20121228/24919_1 /TAXON_ID=665100 ORGANISM="Litonotus pictus, Strain P1" /NCGR_SAMPLE_ID=MMETSP0209 /ASSEMBLY_ACC=CAM_ASM_000301 /LENGTH=86 /DNA_ID=CAMNT_0010821653 /DNA_START=361 /DNA_END=621 /DNA_ORIENTATION=-